MPEMGTKDTPQGIVGFKFAQALLSRDYDTAHAMLGAELELKYPLPVLKQRFEEVISNANPSSKPPDVEVMDNSGLGDASLDAKGWAYVAIWSEAVTITVKPFGADYLITDLIWGRP
jgi:hypothetical protein